jgi:Domain of unknown function (DUF4838)
MKNDSISRRHFLQTSAGSIAGMSAAAGFFGSSESVADSTTPLATRGIVLCVSDLESLDWPTMAARAGLSTIGTHMYPNEVVKFFGQEKGQRFVEGCRKHNIAIEHELHSMSNLLPRELFKKNPTLFRMNDEGERVREFNCCVHSKTAIDLICENAVRYARLLRPDTGRYFFWIDDGAPMCRCAQCKELTDSDQALLLENKILAALREVDSRATLAHLAYLNTLEPPKNIKPDPGVFLEFAPIWRLYDQPLSRRDVRPPSSKTKHPTHGETLDNLDANLEFFGAQTAQVLEYWLDVSRFSSWNRKNLQPIDWHSDVFLDDIKTYTSRGIRHITSFGAWIDADYLKRFGAPPLDEYNRGLVS